jgi:hypothetical protein
MEDVNEKSTYAVKLSFKDENGVAVIPDSLTYRLDDEASGAEIIEDTVVTPVSSTYYNVVISSASNSILNDDKKFEIKVLSAKFVYATDKVGTADYKYKVLNLKYLS